MAKNFLNTRKLIKSDELRGPRVYSTDLLPAHFGPANPDESLLITARALKIKIITKGLVTLNSTYLVSPLGVRLVEAYPDIFGGPAILPAFRTDKSTLEDLIASTEGHEAAGIDEKSLQLHIATLEATIGQAMPWELGQVGDNFKTTLIRELQNPRSPIRIELSQQGGVGDDMKEIVTEIAALDFSDSKNLRNYISKIDDKRVREPLKRFATACYHIVGTSVVKCETGTDLNPLSSFKATDLILSGRDATPERLSENAVFLDAFMGAALSAIQASMLPAQIIDSISFGTAHQLSTALRTQGFQEKYDRITSAYVRSISESTPEQALEQLDAEMIASTARDLAGVFQKEILNELPGYETAIHAEAKGELYRSGADVAKAAAAFAPGLHYLVAVADVIKSGAEASEAGSRFAETRTPQKAFHKAEEERQEKIKGAIEQLRLGTGKRTELLEAAALLSDIYSIKSRRA
jgi:hypothetical protein